MRKQWSIAYLAMALATAQLSAQTDPVLFTVNDKPVNASEFKYIYDKNNGNKADYSEKSLKEYLNLYIDFKLQVAKAYELKLNETDNVKREQTQFRAQLANNYLTDREITEKLAKEAYERMKEDRKVSHIYFAIKEGATDAEIQDVYSRAKKVRDLVNPSNFADMAKQYSEDAGNKDKGGVVGWFAVMQLPYEFENAMYNTTKGQISDVVRTPYGFHIIKVEDTRPAYGEIQTAQLLIRKTTPNAKQLIDSIYVVLTTGGNFETMVLQYSEDNASKTKAGLLGWVSINKYAEDFENTIFALKKDGEFSKPIESSAGWHILKRIKARGVVPFQEAKGELVDKIKKDARFELVQKSLVDKIKKENSYTIDEKVKATVLADIKNDPNFFNSQWNPAKPELLSDERVLFTIGDSPAKVKEIIAAGQRYVPERVNINPRTPEAALDRIIAKVTTQRCLAYEETQLDKKYPEFKSLLREYEEGILLFEVKQQLIWNKASNDEEGLKKYYEAHKDKYKWQARVKATLYTINSTDAKEVKKILKAAKKSTPEQMKDQFNASKATLQTATATYTKGMEPRVDKLKWKAGTTSAAEEADGKTTFVKIEELLPETVKTMEEARGYIVADYQDSVEKDLLKQLRSQYTVKINEDVLKTMVKK